jgi:DNA-binding MarR family transcriptional regulator
MTKEQRKEQIIENIILLSDKAFRELLPILPKEWLRLNLTTPQLKVVILLFVNGPSRMGEIASALGVSLATATGVVDRLVERGILVREDDPDDRRVVLCHLSGKGKELIGGLWQISQDQIKELMGSLAAHQLLLITEALEVLVQAAEAAKEGLHRD